MMERYLEAFFRHLLLIVLPVIVIPLDVTAWVLSTPPKYEARAGMWVEQATYLNYTSDDINRYLPPSQNQRNRLNELLQSRSFVADVASKAGLAATVAGSGADEELRQILARDLDTVATGDHLLVLRFRSESSAVATGLLTTLVESFKSRAASDRYGQAQVAITFYQGRVAEAEKALADARSGLAKFLSQNPSVQATLAKGGVDAARVDPGFAEAQRRVDSAQRDDDAARAALDRAQLDVSAGLQGFELGFRLIDPVSVSSQPSRQLKTALVYPIAAIVIGLLVGAALLLLFALSDRSVRSLTDLGPEIVILGALPRLKPVGVAGRQGPGLTRRAIGFVAGAPLMRARNERKAS